MSSILDDIPEELPGAFLRTFQGIEGTAATQGKPALAEKGIVFQGIWRQFADGFARHTRETVRALAKAGVPLHLDSLGVGSQLLNDDLEEDVRALEYLTRACFQKTQLVIKQVIWGTHEHLVNNLQPRSMHFQTDENVERALARTIVYTVWERDRVAPKDVELLNKLGQVWVGCQSTYDAFLSSGVEASRLRIVPYSYDPDDRIAIVKPRKIGFDPEPPTYVPGVSSLAYPRAVSGEVPPGRRFYIIGRWDPRKNQHRILGLFLKTFKPTSDASLMIKTSKLSASYSNYPTPEESVRTWLEDPTVQAMGWTAETFGKRVRVIDETISDAEIAQLHARNNVYLSLGHGEGWDVPAFEARLAGNRLVYTDWGGMRDYAGPDDLRVPFDFVPVDTDYGAWEGGPQWANPHTNAIKYALATVRPPEKRIQDPTLYARFGRAMVGRRMRGYLEELLATFGETLQEGYG